MYRFECPFCDKTFPPDPLYPLCPDCHEPLLCTRPDAARRIKSDASDSLERFQDYLPLAEIDPSLRLGEGNSPLLELQRLRRLHHLPLVFGKNEIFNPTASFKDRGSIVAVHIARTQGFAAIGTVSTGNMAVSTAAYGARAGIKTFVLVKEDTSEEKMASAGIHGAVLVKVRGDYGELFHESYRIGRRHGIYFMNSTDPFRIEGYKVPGLEIFMQLGETVPDYIFVPVSSGGNIIGLIRAFQELRQQGLVKALPHFVGVQAEGSAAVARAFAAGEEKCRKLASPRSVAQSIINPSPPGGNIVLSLLRRTGGEVISVSDREILDAQRQLAEIEGIFCLPASATTLAGLLKLHRLKRFSADDRIVLVITGSGLKNLKAIGDRFMTMREVELERLESTIGSLI